MLGGGGPRKQFDRPNRKLWANWEIMLESAGDWDPRLRAVQSESLDLSEESVSLFFSEKDEAAAPAQLSLQEIEAAQERMPSPACEELRSGFARLAALPKAQREWDWRLRCRGFGGAAGAARGACDFEAAVHRSLGNH